MNRLLFNGAWALGFAVLAWVAAGFLGSHHMLALAMTLIIAIVFGLGGLELYGFRRATGTLSSALAQIPEPLPVLEAWLDTLHPSLRNGVRLRIDGERTGLPGPTLTPYLVGLLVMLGMLGTFLGMVVTLDGTVLALEGTTDLQAMRTAFATPIKGLGLAFGTSVAGVASSALLGLMSAMSRRERLASAQILDTAIATRLRPLSASYQRQEAFKALQAQTQALPAVVDQLQKLMQHMERMGQQQSERLMSSQQSLHDQVHMTFATLASSVEKSLHSSLNQSALMAGESLKPVVQMAMAGVAQEAQRVHTQLVESAQTQLDALAAKLLDQAQTAQQAQAHAEQQRLQAWTASLERVASQLHAQWQDAGAQLKEQHTHTCRTLENTAHTVAEQTQTHARATLAQVDQLLSSTETLVRTRQDAEAAWAAQHTQHMDVVADTLHTGLLTLRDQQEAHGTAAVARLGDLQSALADHLATLGTALEAPITRLIQTAAEAPRAAAEVIAQLRSEMSNSVARDNALLEERGRILETLNGLLDSIRHASVEQRSVIDALVASSAVALQQATGEFADKLGVEAGKLSDVAAHVSSGAVEVASLSEAFGFAVRSFAEANEKLIDNLQRMEAAMDKSMVRSDEQLAYYVAQAREIIDLSVGSHKQVLDSLRELPQNTPATEAAL